MQGQQSSNLQKSSRAFPNALHLPGLPIACQALQEMGSLEQTLFVHKEVDLYKIPPRFGAGGHRSGDWRTDDKIFTARCKVVAQGERLEVRLEDPNRYEVLRYELRGSRR